MACLIWKIWCNFLELGGG